MGTIEKQIDDVRKVVFHLLRFAEFVSYQDQMRGIKRDNLISFRDSNGFLGIEEDYKSRIAEAARSALQYEKWEENWIGSGKIAKCATKAMGAAGNLVFISQQLSFKRKINPESMECVPNAEQVLYDIYRGDNEQEAFEHAIDIFGAKYSVIAFLFFIKDDTRYLPISPENFDLSFKDLGIDFSTSRQCSWNNYNCFIDIIREIQGIMDDVLPLSGRSRLIDAHSFVWIINETKYRAWQP